MPASDVVRLMELYPRIYFACHTRHVRDARGNRTLSSHQASILDHLDDVEATNLGDLAKHMGVTPSTMSLAVRRLVRQGYVQRRPDDDDRRRVLLTLTAAGSQVKAEKSVLDPERCARVLGRLAPRQRAAALEGLALLAAAAREEMHARAVHDDLVPWRGAGRK